MRPDKPIENAGDGNCHHLRYRGENLYVTLTEQSLDLTMRETPETEHTTVGLGVISRLTTRLLEDEIDYEELASIFFSESRHPGDLADMLTKTIEQAILDPSRKPR